MVEARQQLFAGVRVPRSEVLPNLQTEIQLS